MTGARRATSSLRLNARLVAVVAVVLALVASCSSGGSTADEPDDTGGPSGVIRIAGDQVDASFDPAASDTSLMYLQPLFSSLVTSSTADGTIKPNLATSWEVEGTRYTFHLRDDVTFTDGTKLDSTVAQTSLARMPQFEGTGITFETPDPLTIVVVTTRVDRVFLDILGGAAGMIASPAQFEGNANDDPIGSGPYVLDSTSSSTVEYVPNPDYVGDYPAKLARMVIVNNLGDFGAQLNALRSDEVDVVTLDAPTADQLPDDDSFNFVTKASGAYALVVQDRDGTKVSALADVRVRQAMAYVMDRDAVADALLFGFGQSATQPTPEGVDGYDPKWDDVYTLDVAKAKSLLAEAGYADGFEFTVAADTNSKTFAEAVQGMLDDVNITMNIEQVQLRFQAMGTNEYPVAVGTVQVGNPHASFALYSGSGLFNPFEVVDPELDPLMETASAASADADLDSVYSQIADITVGDAYIVTVALTQSIAVTNDKVENLAWAQSNPALMYLEMTAAS